MTLTICSGDLWRVRDEPFAILLDDCGELVVHDDRFYLDRMTSIPRGRARTVKVASRRGPEGRNTSSGRSAIAERSRSKIYPRRRRANVLSLSGERPSRASQTDT